MSNKKLTPLKAIKHYCKEECCAGDRKSWVECTIPKCALFPFRFGKRDNSTKEKKVVEKQEVLQRDSTKQDTLQESSNG